MRYWVDILQFYCWVGILQQDVLGVLLVKTLS
jgi:hypothetical protein